MTAFTSGCTTSGLKRWPFQTNLGSAYKRVKIHFIDEIVLSMNVSMCKIDTEPDNSLKNLFEFEGNGLNFKLKHRKVYIQFYLWDSVARSRD